MNHLRIIKLRLVVGLDAKFFLLLKKLTLFQTKVKVKCLMLEKGLQTLLAICMFNWLSVNHVFLQYLGGTATPFRTRFYNYKSGARKVSKAYPNKCNVYQEQFHLHFNSEGRRPLSYRNQSIDLLRKSMDWFLDDNGLRHERVNSEGHSGIKDWKITITAFIPNKLNERFVDILMLYICFKFLLRAFIAFAT